MAVSRIIEKLAEFNRDERGCAVSLGPAYVLAIGLLLAVLLGGCAGQQRTYSPAEITKLQLGYSGGPRPLAFTECQSQVQMGDHFECGPIAPATQVALAVPPPAAHPVRSVPIEYIEGQPMVRIEVAGVANFRCLVDTGSSDLVIPGWMLLKLHDKYGLSDSDWYVVGIGSAQIASGNEIKTYRVKFREIDIGSWRLTDVPVVITSPGSHCLLGMSVLKAFGHPMIDFANQRLILED